AGVGEALAQLEVADQVAARMKTRSGRCQCSDRVRHWLQHLVFDPDLPRSPLGDLRMIGCDEGHRLALVADYGLGQHRLVGMFEPEPVGARDVVVGEDGMYAGWGQRLADTDRLDPGGRIRAAQRGAPQHSVHPQVTGVGELTGDLERPVWPGRTVPDAAGRGRRDLIWSANWRQRSARRTAHSMTIRRVAPGPTMIRKTWRLYRTPTLHPDLPRP